MYYLGVGEEARTIPEVDMAIYFLCVSPPTIYEDTQN